MNPNRFRIVGAALLVGAFALTIANPAAAFIRLTRQGGSPGSPVVQAHWLDSALPLVSVINPDNADIPRATALAVVQASAETWEDINTSYFTVDPVDSASGTFLPVTLNSTDGQNSVFFTSDSTDAFFPPGGVVIAFVRSTVDLTDGHTLDADMVYNDRDFFSSTSSPGLTPAPPGQISVDLQSVITHEYGHYFGLDHTSIANATMIPFILGSTVQRTLELDDRAGNSVIYPESASRPGGLSPGAIDFAATTGTVSGTVLSGFTGLAVFGAHVEALLLSSPGPENAISAVSGELTLRNGQGDFTIYGLPPGSYGIRIVPLDGINTIAADPNIGGVFNGIDINFPVEFWNGAGESGIGFNDVATDLTPVSVVAGANSGGINFITNAFAGRVDVTQLGATENFVTDRNTGFRSVRFDLPFSTPYTIQSAIFPTFTFNAQVGLPPLPATFPSVRLCPMDAAGGPDLANPLFTMAPFVGSPNGGNEVPINLTINTPDQTVFWVWQFPARPASFPLNHPFIRMDFSFMERGLFANSYSTPTAGTPHTLSIDRNLAVTLRCQLNTPSDAPIVASSNFGANLRATKTEFGYARPADVRADGFPLPNNSLDHVELLRRVPTFVTEGSGGAGATSISLNTIPAGIQIWTTRAVDKLGHRSLTSNATITGFNVDADEPNGRANEATVLTPPVANRPETISPGGDQDYFSLMAKPGDVIDASANATGLDGGNDMDPVMFLLDTSGEIVAFDDDSGPGNNSHLTFTVPPPGGNAQGQTPRKFTLWVADIFNNVFLAPTFAPRVLVPETYNLNATVTTPEPSAAAQFSIGGAEDRFLFKNSGPNPANPTVKLLYVLPRSVGAGVGVKLRIYDVSGRLVRTLVDNEQTPGPHLAVWDGKAGDGRGVASGNYYARIDAGQWNQKVSITILK